MDKQRGFVRMGKTQLLGKEVFSGMVNMLSLIKPTGRQLSDVKK